MLEVAPLSPPDFSRAVVDTPMHLCLTSVYWGYSSALSSPKLKKEGTQSCTGTIPKCGELTPLGETLNYQGQQLVYKCTRLPTFWWANSEVCSTLFLSSPYRIKPSLPIVRSSLLMCSLLAFCPSASYIPYSVTCFSGIYSQINKDLSPCFRVSFWKNTNSWQCRYKISIKILCYQWACSLAEKMELINLNQKINRVLY